MRTIDWIDNDKKDVKWIVDMFKNELLFVDNSFQRRYVWLERHQVKLIETILLGYAIPEIYIWVTDTDVDTGDTKYSIIDGQQRIGAVVDFIKGNFKLKATYLDDSNCRFVNKKFDELEDEDKRIIWRYAFSMRVVKAEVERDNIVKLFLRLNSTDKSLNPQELRNAEFDGEFLRLANEISNLSFWKVNEIFSNNDLRRMKDIEFISSILMFFRLGIEAETTQKAINDAYDMFNKEYEEYENDKDMFIKIIKEIDKLINYNRNVLKVISKTTHLYTLIIVIYSIILQQNELCEDTIKKMSYFYNNYDNIEAFNEKEEEIRRYKSLALEGTKRKGNRLERVRILSDIIDI